MSVLLWDMRDFDLSSSKFSWSAEQFILVPNLLSDAIFSSFIFRDKISRQL
jgi:hypothetical protein